MEALYHQTNGLLSQTQGYYVRLEQVDGYITIFVSQNWLNWSSQGSPGDDLERLEVEVKSPNLIIITYIQCSATYFISPYNWWTSLQSPQVRGRLETLWANSERLEMLASKEPVARRQVEIYVRIRFTYHSAAVLLIFCIIYQLSHWWIPRQLGAEWINWRVISRCASNNSYTFLFSQIQFSSNDDPSLW